MWQSFDPMRPLTLTHVCRALTTLLLCCSGMAYGDAFSDRFTLNGFGYQDYRQTSANNSDGADPRGTWTHNFLGLVFSGQLSDRSKVWAQLQSNGIEQTRFTWMFVDYTFTDALTGHAGRVKFPYGLSNEYIDNKALQMTVTLPFAYAESADMAYDSYNGVGLDWNTDLGKNGSALLQAYGGNIYTPPIALVRGSYLTNPATYTEAPTNDRRLLGGRMIWNTPLEGMRLMFSGNVAQVELRSPTILQPTGAQLSNEIRYMLSIEYHQGNTWVQAEYNQHRYPGFSYLTGYPNTRFAGVNANAWYLQSSYDIGRFSPFARVQSVTTDQNFSANPNYFEHQVTLGGSYKISKNLNARLEINRNRGYAIPVNGGWTPFNGGSMNWNEVASEINFIF